MTYVEILAAATQARKDGFTTCLVTSFRRGGIPPCRGRVHIGRGGPDSDLVSWTEHGGYFHALTLTC